MIEIWASLLYGIGIMMVTGLFIYFISQFEEDKEENEVTKDE